MVNNKITFSFVEVSIMRDMIDLYLSKKAKKEEMLISDR